MKRILLFLLLLPVSCTQTSVVYEKEAVYYSQKDDRWSSFPFDSDDKPLGKTGCGVTAMAMILSTVKQREILPTETAVWAMENGLAPGYTTRPFFSEVVKEEKWKLDLIHYGGGEHADEVKKLLSDGQHIAAAIMVTGHFTKDGHYIVLYGVTKRNGRDYFYVMDPNSENDRYGTDESVIFTEKGHVLADCRLFENECEEYWVYGEK